MRWLSVAACAMLVAACGTSAEPSFAAYRIVVSGETFRVRLTDPAAIGRLEARRASGRAGVVAGRLLPGDGGWNAPWSWHLDPATVDAPDVAIELCDGRPSMVEADTAYWIRTVRQFCPWGARVIAKE